MATRFLLMLSALVILTPILSKAVGPTMRNASDKPAAFLKVYPIGRVHKRGPVTTIEIDTPYRDALSGLDGFSHVWVLWWFDRNDTPSKRRILQVHPRGNPQNPRTGVFATRAPVRPNLIGLSLCKVKATEGGVLHVDDIDAFDQTPVLDLKPYLPDIDHEPGVKLPDWARHR
jgi:tRNA-Thr(GGU) m(6)t(6)A37 methyltransferase TsaA